MDETERHVSDVEKSEAGEGDIEGGCRRANNTALRVLVVRHIWMPLLCKDANKMTDVYLDNVNRQSNGMETR